LGGDIPRRLVKISENSIDFVAPEGKTIIMRIENRHSRVLLITSWRI